MDATTRLIHMALEEDIGSGDITTDPLVDDRTGGTGTIRAKESLVVAGLDIARQVFEQLDPRIEFSRLHQEGHQVQSGEALAKVTGNLGVLLKGERTALNFLQRLCGIATLTRSYVDSLGDTAVRLTDTRKTTPGWRTLEKYAVRMGGASNHRMGLYDGVLIKDNHIAVCGGINKAVRQVRRRVSHLVKIEVEAADMAQVKDAVNAGVDVIMLDNMSLDQIKGAVQWINKRALVEVSGGIVQENVAQLADTGVDIISVGALTHSARNMDINMTITATSKPHQQNPAAE